MRRVLRSKDRNGVETVRRDTARDVTQNRAPKNGQATELETEDVSSEGTRIMVVGPPGCCGCVSNSVRPRSQRNR
jgi:hypothetical protein